MADRKYRTTVEFDQDYIDKLREICEITRRTNIGELRFLIDIRSVELGLDPVAKLQPSVIASILSKGGPEL